MTAIISFALGVVGLTLMVFSLGALLGWAWATKSLIPRPPYWITGVLATAGLSIVGSAALRSDWLSAASSAALFTVLVVSNLRIGPWRPKSGDRQAT